MGRAGRPTALGVADEVSAVTGVGASGADSAAAAGVGFTGVAGSAPIGAGGGSGVIADSP